MARDPHRPLREAWIVDAVRTPIGRYGGALAPVRPDDLAALVIRAIVDRTGVDPSRIEDVILGCANQAGEDNRNVARMAALLAGLPVEVAGQTVNRLCGSGLQAVNAAAHAIGAGDGDLFVAGGVESMTRAPYVMLKPEGPYDRGARTMEDTTLGWRFVNPRCRRIPRSRRARRGAGGDEWSVARTARTRSPESQRRAVRDQGVASTGAGAGQRPGEGGVTVSSVTSTASDTTARPRGPAAAFQGRRSCRPATVGHQDGPPRCSWRAGSRGLGCADGAVSRRRSRASIPT